MWIFICFQGHSFNRYNFLTMTFTHKEITQSSSANICNNVCLFVCYRFTIELESFKDGMNGYPAVTTKPPSNLHQNEWMNHRRHHHHHQMQAAAELAVDPLAASSLILQNQQSETSPFILWCIFGRNTWVMMRTTSFEQFHLNLLLNWQRIVLFSGIIEVRVGE